MSLRPDDEVTPAEGTLLELALAEPHMENGVQSGIPIDEEARAALFKTLGANDALQKKDIQELTESVDEAMGHILTMHRGDTEWQREQSRKMELLSKGHKAIAERLEDLYWRRVGKPSLGLVAIFAACGVATAVAIHFLGR